MKLLALLLALTYQAGQQTPQQPPADPNTLPYQNLLLLMKFDYPKTWQVTNDKKGDSRFLIPIPNSSDRAVVEISSVSFRGEAEQWQVIEVGNSKTLKQDVERQWDEEILGVKLLLTKVNYTEEGTPKTSETGLLYTFGFNKLMFRITAEPSEFDQVDHDWRKVLQTLRTWDGEMPTPEDPTKKIERKEVKPGFRADEVAHPQVPHDVHTTKTAKPVQSPVATTLEFAGKKIDLRIPAEWKVESTKDMGFRLNCSGMEGPVDMVLYPLDGADPPELALQKNSAAALNDFASVAFREESLPVTNRAGASVAWILRSGANAKGGLFTCEAFCQTGPYYGLLTYRTTYGAKWKAEEILLKSLLEQMSIDIEK